MELFKFIQSIDFLNKLNIEEEEVTTSAEKEDGQIAVIVKYSYEENVYLTPRLYYRNVSSLSNVKSPNALANYFGGSVYWLDVEEHDWPHGKGAEIEKTIIDTIVLNNDPEFVALLKQVANNNKSGYLQEITKDGRSQQYGFNFENNNHWHDLINLVKEIIRTGGELPERKYFQRLVFEWDDGKRVSLSPELGSRQIIHSLCKNVTNVQSILKQMETAKLLKVKGQIILQGPPGTGKTRHAKEIANQLAIEGYKFSTSDIGRFLKAGDVISTPTRYNVFTLTSVVDNKVKLKPKDAQHEYMVGFDEISDCINSGGLAKPVTENNEKGNSSYKVGLAKYVVDKFASENVKLIQFHPSYSYEDFVRGIRVRNNGTNIEYRTENRIIAELAAKAERNYADSQKDKQTIGFDIWLENKMTEFTEEEIQHEIDTTGKYSLTDSAYIYEADEDGFRYKGDNWSSVFRIPIVTILQLYKQNVMERKQMKELANIPGSARQHATYYFNLLANFRRHIKDQKPTPLTETLVQHMNYVLIIDEINRANLSSVLGELIYALEYRGESVESMYDLNGERRIALPKNFFIIGTMNTADRSVGHIDYAIRRRFAFVSVLPSAKVIDEVVKDPLRSKAQMLYSKVSALFESGRIAPDFDAKDVQIGHSYFLASTEEDLKLKLEYEIKPLLREYWKDGILLNECKDEIEALNV